MLNLHLVACVCLITMPEMIQVIVREREIKCLPISSQVPPSFTSFGSQWREPENV